MITRRLKSEEWTIISVSKRQEREILRYSIMRTLHCSKRSWRNLFT